MLYRFALLTWWGCCQTWLWWQSCFHKHIYMCAYIIMMIYKKKLWIWIWNRHTYIGNPQLSCPYACWRLDLGPGGSIVIFLLVPCLRCLYPNLLISNQVGDSMLTVQFVFFAVWRTISKCLRKRSTLTSADPWTSSSSIRQFKKIHKLLHLSQFRISHQMRHQNEVCYNSLYCTELNGLINLVCFMPL